MIRHTNSMLISLFIHFTIFIAVFYSFTNISKLTVKEEKVCIKLCSLQQTKQEVQTKKLTPQEMPIEEKIEPKIEIKKEIPKPVPAPTKIEPKKVALEKKEKQEKVIEQVNTTVQNDTDIPKKDIVEATHAVASTQNAVQNEVILQEVKEEDEYLQEHLALITKLLEENLYYPRSARKRAITGDVVVKFKLMTDATVAYINVMKSPSEVLSRGAVQTIENVSAKFPKPKKDLILEVPISYKLSN
ncbi:TonB family protein [bacterium]|nr:TonB family protein [bacterium]MBU1433352.1 TonB family protein [bacterium]MBU1503466.1 TonB family protein [bacterium]